MMHWEVIWSRGPLAIARKLPVGGATLIGAFFHEDFVELCAGRYSLRWSRNATRYVPSKPVVN